MKQNTDYYTPIIDLIGADGIVYDYAYHWEIDQWRKEGVL